MKTRALFVLLVLILLSSAAAAVEKTETHTTKTGQAPQLRGDYTTHRQNSIMYANLASAVGFMSPIASTVLLAMSGMEARAAEASRRTILERRGYAFYDFVEAYDDWSGLNRYGVLFYGEEGLAKRRDMAAEYFCEHALGLLGGKQCWISRICAFEYGAKDMPPGRSVLVAQTGIGGFLPAVSVQGEKSLPIQYKEAGKAKAKYVYKITYSIANPHVDRTLNYHVKLVGDTNTYTSEAMTVKAATEDDIFRESRLGNNPYVVEDDHNYHTVCLTFAPRMVTNTWNRQSELCSPISQYEGAATRPYSNTPPEENE